MKNILSFDIEEIFHGPFTNKLNLEKQVRSDDNVPPILDVLDEYNTKATFFIVGECVSDNLLKDIATRGHEIGFHTMRHTPLWESSPESLGLELHDFRLRVKSVTGNDCVGFRAPCFSLDKSTAWALQSLRNEGFKYDSSVFPMRSMIYGMSDAPRVPYQPDNSNPSKIGQSGLIEIPMTVGSLLRVKIPVAGGFYFRVIPNSILSFLLDRVERSGNGLVLYIHNWELDPNLPKLKMPWKSSFYCYHNRGKTVEKRLRMLLKKHQFTSFQNALRELVIADSGLNVSV